MQNQSWAHTMDRLRRWQSQPPSQATVWELRRILLDSIHIRLIGFCAAKRALGRLDGESWQQWWERDLPRLPEQDAMKILLDVWNKDVWAHLQWLGAQNAAQTIARVQAYPNAAPTWNSSAGDVCAESAFDPLALAGFNLALAEPLLPGLESGQQAALRDRRSRASLAAAQQALASRERMVAFLALPQTRRRPAPPVDFSPMPPVSDDAAGSDAIEPGAADRSDPPIGCDAAKSAGGAPSRH